ncbi:glycerol-3-phosphate dehydrogenase/oxidase [Gleimia hominis]|uniref:glycerol-3-phosphate dehydrogenase/oxidase n=1 Tax=Gleimia hominis TaxID=595468 RepID=UPI000C807D47|nr:glycerol-3-phosphate dehydrogenase/oxidase [Gleimia hominis]WIK63834.1 glycerol-3-phosphate dehydrogenase/oxidase [Gleimia hominis]
MREQNTFLTAHSRAQALKEMTDEEGVDILVIGGGVTGAGIALDAASRGLRTAVVEAGDWASGTSAWSSKLVHGGLRYLYNLDFALVAEALKERGLLLTKTAPHLVKAQPFLWPLKTPVVERAYSAVGVGMYDAMAQWAHRGSVPVQKHYSRSGAMKLFPGIKPSALTGAIRFYDARVDDARLVVDLVRTASGFGALAAPRTQVVGLTKTASGAVNGARIVDLESGKEMHVNARHVINATGVWTEETEKLGGTDGGLKVLASKGIHIVVPRERINAQTGIFLRTEKSVLFIIPWQRYWVIGTTDTPYEQDISRPVATKADVDYVLDHANEILADPLTREDIIGVYAGLRPLLQPGVKGDKTQSTKVSREHTVTAAAPNLTVIAGGKLTTYRPMAQDAVDFALGEAEAKRRPSITENVPLVGAEGFFATARRAPAIASKYGWTAARVESLLDRYGAEIDRVLDLLEENPDLAQPLKEAPQFLRAEVVAAVRFEGALHLEDVLVRRVRLDLEQRDRGVAAAPEVADLMRKELGWDEQTAKRELDSYRQRTADLAKAETLPTDEQAASVVTANPEIVPRRTLA